MGPCIRLAFVSCCDLLLLALYPGGTILSLGSVSWWDHTLCWHCVLRGSYLMLDFVPDVTYFLWAVCPGGTIPYVGIVF